MTLPQSVRWNPEFQEELIMGRGLYEGTKKRSPGRSKLVRDVAKSMTRIIGDGWSDITVPDDLSAALPAVLASAEAPDTKAPLSHEHEVLAYAITCLFPRWIQFTRIPTQSPKLVRKWFHLGGAAFAVRTLCRAVNLMYTGGWQMTENKRLNLTEGCAFVDRALQSENIDHHKRDGAAHALAFRTLRELLTHVDADEYAAAVAAGEEARKTASLTLRTWLTFAMPTQSEWATADATAMLKLDPVPKTYVLLMDSVPDFQQGIAMHAKQERPHNLALHALLSRHGDAPAPALVSMTKQAFADRRHLLYWWALDALAQIPTPESVAFLVETHATQSDSERKHIVHLFQSAPEVALPVLQANVGQHPSLQGPIDAILRANPELDVNAAPLASADDLPALLRSPPAGKAPPDKDWDLGRLPPLRLLGTAHTLAPDAVMALGHALHASKGKHSAALDEALQAIEPADRAALANVLWEAWSEGHNRWTVFLAARKWLGLAQGLLGNDDVARRMATEVATWSGQRFNQGKACLFALQTIGTDAAIEQLHMLYTGAKSKGIRRAANQTLKAIAEARGVSVSELPTGAS